jgi:putative alpha-1,2-mannosidase
MKAQEKISLSEILLDFEKVRNDAKETWTTQLSKIIINDSSEEKKKIILYALYHASIVPNIYFDVLDDTEEETDKFMSAKILTIIPLFQFGILFVPHTRCMF